MIPQVLWFVLASSWLVGAMTPANCTDSSYDWVFNSLGQSPCEVAQELAAMCSPGGVTLPQLEAENAVYYGPTKGQNDTCQCTTVFYSLVSACAACQDRGWIDWSQFVQNCTTAWIDFPSPTASNIQIPPYAFLNVTGDDTFDPHAAAEASGAYSPPTVSRPSSTPTSPSHRTRARAIVAGVVPAVVGLAAAVGILLWFYRRRKITGPPNFKRSSKQYVQLSDSLSAGPALITTPKPALFQHRRGDSHASDVFRHSAERSV